MNGVEWKMVGYIPSYTTFSFNISSPQIGRNGRELHFIEIHFLQIYQFTLLNYHYSLCNQTVFLSLTRFSVVSVSLSSQIVFCLLCFFCAFFSCVVSISLSHWIVFPLFVLFLVLSSPVLSDCALHLHFLPLLRGNLFFYFADFLCFLLGKCLEKCLKENKHPLKEVILHLNLCQWNFFSFCKKRGREK